MSPSTVVHIDFETASELDLKRVGAYRYARHPSTRVVCVAWAIGDGPVQAWTAGEPLPVELLDAVRAGASLHAWNAAFERCVWPLFCDVAAPVERWFCTMAQAAHWGLPLSLDQAGPAADLPIVKDAAGHRLMLQMSRPRKDGSWWHRTDPEKLARLVAYCRQDVEVERAVGARLPPLPIEERETWLADQEINDRGMRLDLDLVRRLQSITETEKDRLDGILSGLTAGEVTATSQVARLLAWVNANSGLAMTSLDKSTVEEALGLPNCTDPAREALLLRQEAARSSTAKLRVMLDAADPDDGRVRGTLQYYGASRTGRWAGRLLQVQNFPRGELKPAAAAACREAVLAGREPQAEGVTTLGIVSSLLRSCIVPAPGHRLVVGDFSQIEARVVAWLAGQQDVLDVFAAGEDVYTHTARKIGSDSRQLGKVLVLACGFGMGAGKFLDTANDAPYRLGLDAVAAEQAVTLWRQNNPKIVQHWRDADGAARAAIAEPGREFRAGRLTYVAGRHLVCVLPSGRQLVYRNARVEPSPREGWDDRTCIAYDGVDQTTRRWTRIETYGGKLVENATQAVARDGMAEAVRHWRRHRPEGSVVIGTVHDELIVEAPADLADAVADRLRTVMSTPPAWADGLPVATEVRVMNWYSK